LLAWSNTIKHTNVLKLKEKLSQNIALQSYDHLHVSKITTDQNRRW